MQPISQVLSEMRGKISNAPHVSPDELERLKAQAMARNMICRVDCPVCGGLGFYKSESGRVVPCPNVDPFLLHPGERYGIAEQERGYTWDMIEAGSEAARVLPDVRRIIERGYGWVYLWGKPGLGKTFTLKIAVAEHLRARKPAAFVRMSEIIDDLRGAFDARNPSEESAARLDFWANIPLLAVDEFDRVRGTPYAEEQRFRLMDSRYEGAKRGKLITLMTSNRDPKEFEGYLADRIYDWEFLVVKLDGLSYRRE